MKLQRKVLFVALPLVILFAGLTAFVARRATEGLMVGELARRLRPQDEDFTAGLAGKWEGHRESLLLARLQQAQATLEAQRAQAEQADAHAEAAGRTAERLRKLAAQGAETASASDAA